MSYSKKLSIFILSFIFFGVIANELQATNGYFRHGYGVKYSALAGSGTALSLSSIGATNNPAGLAFLGNRYDFNVSLFSPNRSFEVSGNPSGFPGTFGLNPVKTESGSKTFFFPTLGANWKLNEKMSLGIVIYGNGGMNTDYESRILGDPTSPDAGVNLEQLFVASSYAIEFSRNHSFGVSGIFGLQRFAAKGLIAFSGFSSSPANLTGNPVSISTGFGARFGYMGKLSKNLSVGASYQTKLYMSEFDDYKGLFAEQGDFDVPANWNVGIAFSPFKKLTFSADYQQILYSGVKSIANKFNVMELSPVLPDGMTPNPIFKALGSDGGAGFGWDDIYVMKFGLMYQMQNDWTLLGGFSYAQQPFDEKEVLFNILAPGVVQSHITLGVSKLLPNKDELNISFMYAPNANVQGANQLEAPGQQMINLEMSQWQIELGYAIN